MNPKISVIVPVYNAEKWLKRCVDSILAQTFTEFELLLIDDGSTDGSPAICDSYAALDPRVRVFHKPNGGVSSARNLGLDNAHGEWIAFCDADDYVEKEWLQPLVSGTQKDCDLVSCGYHWYKEDNTSGEFIPEQFSGDKKDYFQVIFRDEMFGSLWNKLFRKAIIDQNRLRLDSNLKFREDEEFLLRYLTHCHTCSIVSRALYHYFMPDWSKYNKYFTNEITFELLRKRVDSIYRLGLTNDYAKQSYSEYFGLMRYMLKKHPVVFLKNFLPAVKYAYRHKGMCFCD